MLYIFCSVNKLAGLSFNGGLMFVGLVPIPYDWHDFIKHHIDADVGWNISASRDNWRIHNWEPFISKGYMRQFNLGISEISY